MIIVAGTPVVTPPDDGGGLQGPPPPETAPLSLSWTSWTGRSWDLTNRESPVMMLTVIGLEPTAPEHWWQDSPSLDGSAWGGLRVPRGGVSMSLLVSGGSSADFLVQRREFVRSLSPRQEGVLRVTHPDGRWREQVCRYESGVDLAAMERDPVFAMVAQYGVTWATDPYWQGEPIAESFVYDAGTAFFPGTPFTLGPSQILGSAVVDNPGDVDAYPVWRIDGPFTGFSVGVGSALAVATITKTAGHWIEIDMRPNKLTVLDDTGTDRWSALTDANFVPIPPGPSDLDTTLLGASAGSAVTLSFTPRYEGAL